MKIKLFISAFFLTFVINSFGQNTPVQNLTWSHWYQYPRNFFQLNWEEPAQPHDELIGYNVYRNNELFRFQTETTVYNYDTPLYGIVTNCDGESFLSADNMGQPFLSGINIHVTAVYNSGLESDYLQNIFDEGLLLSTSSFTKEKAILFPNPTKGFLNIGNLDIETIIICDISGKVIREFEAAPQINLSDISKGLYIIKLLSERQVIVDKIIIE
jgi:hypothetical protein